MSTSMHCSPPGSSVHGDVPGKNTRVGCHALLHRIFSTQGLNLHLLHLLHWQADSLPLHHLGSPFWSRLLFLMFLEQARLFSPSGSLHVFSCSQNYELYKGQRSFSTCTSLLKVISSERTFLPSKEGSPPG